MKVPKGIITQEVFDMHILIAVVLFFAAVIFVKRGRKKEKAESDRLTEELRVALKRRRDEGLRVLEELEEELKREAEGQASDSNVVRGEWPQWKSK